MLEHQILKTLYRHERGIHTTCESFGGYGQEFGVLLEDLHNIARYHLRLTDGESVINEMLNQIAFHVIGLNGLIMK
jgi:hypothetical protein